jgi:hypothetical protein
MGGGEDVGKERPARQRMQDLRQARAHAGPLTRGEDGDA